MYKVTIVRKKYKFWGIGPAYTQDIEQYINDFSKQGYDLVSVVPAGFWFMYIWKKS